MRTKVTRTSTETAVMRILDALAREAIEAPDEEIIEVATELRMDLTRSDSAAFAGLTYFARPQLSEFFDVGVAEPAAIQHIHGRLALPKKGQGRSRRRSSTGRNPSRRK
jgi:hypothetical protein